MSIFWRTYASSWAKSEQLQNWTASCLAKAVCFGKGARGDEDVAAQIQEKLLEGGLLQLWSQAYDRMRPEVTKAALAGVGFPLCLAC